MEMIEENALTSSVCVCTFFYCSKLCIMYLEEEMATTPVFLLGESHGERSLMGYNPWGPRVRHD